MKDCRVCAFYERRHGKELCARPRKMKSGRRINASTFILYETSAQGGEERADGDHCGPNRIHFKAGSVM